MIAIQKQISLSFDYDFDRALTRLASDPINDVDKDQRLIRFPTDDLRIITLRSLGTKEKPRFLIEGAQTEAQIQRIESIFHFDRSLDPIQKHFKGTDLEPLFLQYAGTPLVQSTSLYGTLMKSIIHQQLNLTFANTLTLRFVKIFGEEIDGVLCYPSPERIATLQIDELRKLQFSQRKAEYIISISQAIVSGKLNLEQMEFLDDEAVTAAMTAFRGIGPWTAQCFLLFGLGRPNLFPVADVGLQNALKKIWLLDRKPTKEEILSHVTQWSPFSSYAALYLWHSIE